MSNQTAGWKHESQTACGAEVQLAASGGKYPDATLSEYCSIGEKRTVNGLVTVVCVVH